jgi:hypothetical protein
MAGAQ